MTIYSFVESEKNFYETQDIPLQDGDDYSQYQLIRSINFTRRNRYIDDNATDDIIGDFPYDNISKYRIRLEARSTDFDFKHIEVEPVDTTDEARIASMVATKALHKEMRRINFSRVLNRFADTRPEYGTTLFKKTPDGIYVVPWENVITDMTDIINSPIIERHYYSPAQLKKLGYKNVDQVIASANQKTKEKDMNDNSDNEAETIGRFIEVMEVTGELPLATLLDAQDMEYTEDDENEFVLCHIMFAPEGKDKKGNALGTVLKADQLKEEDFPYKIDVRHPVVGRGFGEGIPEELSEHQRWHNFYKTEEARAVAIGGKVLFVTNDGDVVDSIYDDGIEHGTIMQVGDDKMFQQLTTMPNSVPVYQNIRAEWADSADKNTSSFDAVLGEESKSGTPFRSQYLQNIAGTSQFEREREDMGFIIKEIVEDWILPDALATAASEDEIDDTFSKEDLQLIDSVLVEQFVIDKRVEAILNANPVTGEQVEGMRQDGQRQLNKRGTRRNIKDIKEFIKKAGKSVVVHTTDEQRSKQVLYESLSNAINMAKGIDKTDPAQLAMRDMVLDQMGITPQKLAQYAEQAMAFAEQLGPQQGGGGAINPKTDALKKEESLGVTI
jgi:hypothetical protein